MGRKEGRGKWDREEVKWTAKKGGGWEGSVLQKEPNGDSLIESRGAAKKGLEESVWERRKTQSIWERWGGGFRVGRLSGK